MENVGCQSISDGFWPCWTWGQNQYYQYLTGRRNKNEQTDTGLDGWSYYYSQQVGGRICLLFWFNARHNQTKVQTSRFEVYYASRATNATTASDWILLKSFQRGKGRFRRNSRWYLGKAAIATAGLETIQFWVESFYPTVRQMVLFDKFFILGYA